MADRIRVISHKAVKQMIAAGSYDEAERVLLGRRQAHLKLLENQNCDEAKAELFLTCTNSLLAECYSLAGKKAAAESWFDHAFSYCRESHDPMVKVRLHRIHAMHLCRTGLYGDALAEIEDVITELLSAKFQLESSLPVERIEIELAYSTSCKAEILLAQHPGIAEGAAFAQAVRPVLRSGSKRRYELQNLMVCISVTNRFTNPLLHRRMMMRAWYVNERFIHSGTVRLRLLNEETIVPAASATRSAARRFSR